MMGKRNSAKPGEPPIKKSNKTNNTKTKEAKHSDSDDNTPLNNYTDINNANINNGNVKDINNIHNDKPNNHAHGEIEENGTNLNSDTKMANNFLQNSPVNYLVQITPDCSTVKSSYSAEVIGSDEGYCNSSSPGQFLGSPNEMNHNSPQVSFSIDPGTSLQLVSDESDIEIIDEGHPEIITDDVMYINSDTPFTHQTVYSEPSSVVVADSVIENNSEKQQDMNYNVANDNTKNEILNNTDHKKVNGRLVKPIWFRSGCFQGKSWKQAAYMLGEIIKYSGFGGKNVKILNKIKSYLENPNGPNVDELRSQINTCLN